jgi:hypothetical protein
MFMAIHSLVTFKENKIEEEELNDDYDLTMTLNSSASSQQDAKKKKKRAMTYKQFDYIW